MPISPESQKPAQNLQAGAPQASSKRGKKKKGRKKHASREVATLPGDQGASKVAIKDSPPNASDASQESRPLIPSSVKPLDLNPKVLVPGSRSALPLEEVAAQADQLDSLYAEIQRSVTEMKDIMPTVSVSCDLQGYKVAPEGVQKKLDWLEKRIEQYQSLLWETYPSIRARLGSDQKMLQAVKRFGAEEVFSREVKEVHERGAKKAVEEKFWRGILLSDILIDFKLKRMQASLPVTTAIQELVKSGASVKAASKGYQRFMGDNLALLQQLYQSIHAREKLGIATDSTGQMLTEKAVECGRHLMIQLHGALNHFVQTEETHAVNGLVAPCKESLMHWLDGFDIKQFRKPAYARGFPHLPLDLVIGYSLLGEPQKALDTVYELSKMLPGVTLGENLPFMLTHELFCLSAGMVFWNGEFNQDFQKACRFRELLEALQGLINQMDECGQMPPGDHYKMTGVIKGMEEAVHGWLNVFHKAEQIASENAQALVDQEQNERHQAMLRRFRRTRKPPRRARPAITRLSADPVDTPEKLEPVPSHEEMKVDSDIE